MKNRNKKIFFDIQNPRQIRQINRGVVNVVHERDDYTCRFCGFYSKKYHDVINPGNNWRDLNKILTACIFCQQCFLLDSVPQMRSGVLISFPDLTQAAINRLAAEIYVARISQGERADQARACLDLLIKARETASSKLGTDSPEDLATMLRECKTNLERLALDKKLFGIRLFPLDRRIIREADLEFNQFPQILAYWRSKHGPNMTIDSLKRVKRFAKKYL